MKEKLVVVVVEEELLANAEVFEEARDLGNVEPNR